MRRIIIPFYRQDWDSVNWRAEDFASEEEMVYWKESSCGVICLRMVIEGLTGRRVTNKQLIDRGIEIQAYTHAQGWSHQGLADLGGHFGLWGEPGALFPQDLALAIDSGKIPIISIKWAFKKKKSWKERILFWKKYGGHLAVVVGYEGTPSQLDGFYVHHTSTLDEFNWQEKLIPIKTFVAGYTGRTILFSQDQE